MDEVAPLVVVGFAEDASWGPSVRLLARGRAGIELLEKAFASHRAHISPLRLTELPGVESEAGAELTLDAVGTGKPTLARVGDNKFAIGGSDDDWAARSALLQSLTAPGFQFLDYENPGKLALVVELVEP